MNTNHGFKLVFLISFTPCVSISKIHILPLNCTASMACLLQEKRTYYQIIRTSICRGLPGPIHVPRKRGRFNKFTILNGLFHSLPGYEVIFFTICFPRSWFPCCMRHREAKNIFEFSHQFLDQCGFPCTRRATQYQGSWPIRCRSWGHGNQAAENQTYEKDVLNKKTFSQLSLRVEFLLLFIR